MAPHTESTTAKLEIFTEPPLISYCKLENPWKTFWLKQSDKGITQSISEPQESRRSLESSAVLPLYPYGFPLLRFLFPPKSPYGHFPHFPLLPPIKHHIPLLIQLRQNARAIRNLAHVSHWVMTRGWGIYVNHILPYMGTPRTGGKIPSLHLSSGENA